MAAMDPDVSLSASPNAFDYSQLDDEQLRSAMRFAEKHLRWVEEDHVTLLRAYRAELDAMRRQLIDRMLQHMAASSALLSSEQRRDLHRAFELRAMDPSEVAKVVYVASRGRATRVDALTEIEAMALLMRLGRET